MNESKKFEIVLNTIYWLNKKNLIYIYLILDTSFSYEFLSKLKNHELKYSIIQKVIWNTQKMDLVINIKHEIFEQNIIKWLSKEEVVIYNYLCK